MSEHTPSSRELDAALTSARQTLAILRSQAQSQRIDAAFFESRLKSVEEVLAWLAAERQKANQQVRLAKLYEVSRAIGSSLDLQTVLNQVMDAIIALTGAERGFLLLQDDDGNLTIPVRRNFDQETIGLEAVSISRTVTNRVLESNQAVVTTNAQEDPRFSGQTSVIVHALRSIMACPLRARGKVIGVVYVDNRARTNLFNEQDLELLETFAAQAAVAIDNARLFSSTDQALNARVEELTMLQRMDRQLNETLDLNNALRVTLEWSSRVCQAQSARVYLLDAESDQPRLVASADSADSRLAEPDLALIQHVLQRQEPIVHQNADHAVLLVPIRRSGRAIGAIVVSAERPNAFSADQQALIVRMADRAAIAIENARLYAAVQAANKAKTEFVGIVAHELKVPMTSINGYADLVRMAGPVNEKQQAFLATIKSAVQRMKILVSDLSDISRIETGNLRVELTRVNVSEIIETVRESIAAEIAQRSHHLQIDLEPNLPAVRADRDRLIQILLNLASNAYKYTPNGGTLRLSAKRDNAHIAFVVADNGVGMTPEQLAKLGTKFWRADNGLEQPGTGLGFAITRSLIALMNGELDVQSTPNQGTTVTFRLPIAE
ncbi:MAG: GAF domain-containing sensor histidine kinase [Anaerolineae bacterium]|nr:GAF domain-containing sensor histidine kinase [Anaerolineae bacterium]